jgi:hypothetical protein
MREALGAAKRARTPLDGNDDVDTPGVLSRRRFLIGVGGPAAAAALLSGCAAADKGQPAAESKSTTTAGMNMVMGGGSTAQVPEVNGVKPVPIQTLATSYWQGMEIQAQTTTPVPFWTVDNTNPSAQRLEVSEVKPPSDASFHLMIMLTDRHTKVPIPYASVWSTILDSAGRALSTGGVQWPMISAYMGPHYGNNIVLPAAGHYTLELLISPPAVARHIEYKDVWLTKHKVTQHFTWSPPA